MEKNERQGLAFFAPFELSALQIGVQRVEKSGSHEPPLTLVFRNVQLCRRSITALPSIPQEHTRFHLRYNKIPLYSILKSYALQLCTIHIVMPVIFWYNFTISSGNYNQKRSVLAMQKKLKKFLSLLLATVMITTLTAPSALAYEKLSHKIKSTLTYTPYSGFGTTSVSHMGEAVSKWNNAAGSTLITISSNTHSSTSGYPTKDGKNYIYRIDVGQDYVAQCYYWWGVLGNLQQSDVNINVYYSFANSAQPKCYDLYSVFLHETGHAMGLKDLYSDSDKPAVMYGYSYVNTTKRNLTTDDKNGITAIYG